MFVAMPIAQPPPGVDPATYYAPFVDNVTASWSAEGGLVIRLSDADPIPTLFAPLRATARFVPNGQPIEPGERPVLEDTLVLKTWPVDYVNASPIVGGPVPALVVLSNVDRSSARSQVPEIVAATPVSVDQSALSTIAEDYMAGRTAILATAGVKLGTAGADTGTGLRRRVTLRMYDQIGGELHPIFYLGKFADASGVDIAIHPLLRLLDFSSATDPSLSAQLVQIEEPNAAGNYRPADYGLFATSTPTVRLNIADAALAADLQVQLEDPTGERSDISSLFTYDQASGAAVATLLVTEVGVHELTVHGPFSAHVRFMVYLDASADVPITFIDEEYVPTNVPEVTRSAKLICVAFAEDSTDADMSLVMARKRLLPVSLVRRWAYVTTSIPAGSSIFERLASVAAEPSVVLAFVPGTVQSDSPRGRQQSLFIIETEDFTFE